MRNVFLEGILVLFLAISMFGCDRYQNQYSKVISDNETKSTKVDCFTFLGLPLACIQVDKYEKTVELIEIVYRFVDRFIIQKEIEYIKVKEIVREVFVVNNEKDVDINEIAMNVLGILNRDYPARVVAISDAELAEVVFAVSEDVIENAPSVVINTETHTVTIERPVLTPQTTVSIVRSPEVTQEPSVETPPPPPPPPPVEDKGEYIVYTHRVNGLIQSGVIHRDHAAIQDGEIFHIGQDGEISDEDTSEEYIKIETGLTYEEAEERSSEILTE
jgi:hypothetical protein